MQLRRFAVLPIVIAIIGAIGLGSQATAAQTIRTPERVPDPVGEDQRVQATALDAVLADPNVLLLDVREPWELEKFGTRQGYVNIPIAELEDRLGELPKEKTILTA